MSTEDSSASPSPFDDAPHGGAGTAPPAEKSAHPRISIWHFLVWTATSAAMMALMQLPREVAKQLSASAVGFRIAFAIYAGIVTGGVLMWIARRHRGIPFPTEPGEWLLVLQGVFVLYLIFVSYLIEAIAPIGAPAFVVMPACIGLQAIGLMPTISYRRENDTLWKLYLVLLAVLFGLPLAACGVGGFVILLGVPVFAIYFGVARPMGYGPPFSLAVIAWIFWATARMLGAQLDIRSRHIEALRRKAAVNQNLDDPAIQK